MNTPLNLDDLVLDAPAQVGNIRFSKGIKWSTVIAAAQRHHAYQTQPHLEQERIAKARVALQDLQGPSESSLECRSPYCECNPGACAQGRIDKRGEGVPA